MRTLAKPGQIARRATRALLAQWPLALHDDLEGIHQTRVASRRLRELVPVLAADTNTAATRRLRRGLREVTRRLGRSRELDVARETLAALEIRNPSHASAIDAVRRHIDHERAGASREMRQAAAGVDIDGLAAGTRDLARRLARPREIRACARRAAARLERRAWQVEQAVLDAGLIFAPGPLHRVRIALKKFRYALEVAEHLGRFRLTGSMLRLKLMQNLLGDLHDLQVMAGHVRDTTALAGGSHRHELEALVGDIDDAIRGLHSSFLAERDRLVPLLARTLYVRRILLALPASPDAPRTRTRTRKTEER